MAAAVSTGVELGDQEAVHASVSKYYGETLQTTSDLKTSACCTAKAPPKEVLDVLSQLPSEIISKYYGCGSPFPVGLKGSGLRVLDLGCGSGRDCYVCAALVGEQGYVTGLDMTPSQLEVAQKHSSAWQQRLGYAQPNMKFIQGHIESPSASGVAANSIDLVISNCVINLSPDKGAVLSEAYKVLADGGELYFSDVYCDRRLSVEIRTHEVLLGECLGGALAVNDFLRLSHQVGFTDPRVLEVEPISVHDPQLRALLGDEAFYSITFRLFKLPGLLEPLPEEDYGQTAMYKGTLTGAEKEYALDNANTFTTGRAVHVSGNTAAMLSGSWLAAHFEVTADKTQHFGQFTSSSGSATLSAASIAKMAAASSSSSTGGSSCCAAPAAAANTSSCCAPAAKAAPKSGCGAPSAPVSAPAAANTSSCCAPAAAAATTTTSTGARCCAPKQASSSSSGCCAPKEPAAAAGAGCCAPKQASSSSSSGGCCAPKEPPAAAVVPAADGGCAGASAAEIIT